MLQYNHSSVSSILFLIFFFSLVVLSFLDHLRTENNDRHKVRLYLLSVLNLEDSNENVQDKHFQFFSPVNKRSSQMETSIYC